VVQSCFVRGLVRTSLLAAAVLVPLESMNALFRNVITHGTNVREEGEANRLCRMDAAQRALKVAYHTVGATCVRRAKGKPRAFVTSGAQPCSSKR